VFANKLSQGIFEPGGIGIRSVNKKFCLGLLEAFSLGSHLLLSFCKGFNFLCKLLSALLKDFGLLSEFLLDFLKGFGLFSKLSFNLTQMYLPGNGAFFKAGHFGFGGLSSFFEFIHLNA